jgi:hypothetical protein
MVSNLSEMILTITLVTRANACVLKPQGVDKILDPQHGEVQCQIWLPHSFVLTNTIPNPMRALTFKVSYHYVEKIPQVKQTSMQHIMMLQQSYPNLLPTSAMPRSFINMY